jgi:hypothetical protein
VTSWNQTQQRTRAATSPDSTPPSNSGQWKHAKPKKTQETTVPRVIQILNQIEQDKEQNPYGLPTSLRHLENPYEPPPSVPTSAVNSTISNPKSSIAIEEPPPRIVSTANPSQLLPYELFLFQELCNSKWLNGHDVGIILITDSIEQIHRISFKDPLKLNLIRNHVYSAFKEGLLYSERRELFVYFDKEFPDALREIAPVENRNPGD